jgi:hypothetical protein
MKFVTRLHLTPFQGYGPGGSRLRQRLRRARDDGPVADRDLHFGRAHVSFRILARPGSNTEKLITSSRPYFSTKWVPACPNPERAFPGKRISNTPVISSLWANIHSPKSLSSVSRIRLSFTEAFSTSMSEAEERDSATDTTS